MFNNADAASPDTSSWNTSNVTNMESIFELSGVTNIDFSSWDFSSVTNFTDMINRAAMSDANYDILLQRMDTTATAVSITLEATGFTYSSGAPAAARAGLITSGWSFIGDIAGP